MTMEDQVFADCLSVQKSESKIRGNLEVDTIRYEEDRVLSGYSIRNENLTQGSWFHAPIPEYFCGKYVELKEREVEKDNIEQKLTLLEETHLPKTIQTYVKKKKYKGGLLY